ncbi:MAG: DNA gyrase subunit A [Deltaproteobacteria bacterium]|nr:MAG: DNA gyrase subunit A [Deltaproteobacteria bacterium]
MNLIPQNKIPMPIEEEMKRSYLDYAMSVIIGRALPDVRDGLKPVHRRVLFAMHDLTNRWDKPYKKSARVVGDVIGKYHPHGDSAVYDTLVRMAQDFSLRYPLVDGQGNFGSIDGDAPAAMRYTEVRMDKLAGELLADIDMETVAFNPNYDGSLEEPEILPCRFPNLLANGSSGIAVGMSTNIPPHNLTELCDALNMLIRNPDAGITEIMQVLPGPDFPTAGYIYGAKGIYDAFTTGKGSVKMRARASVERNSRTNREAIVITELPYTVNKAKVVEEIAGLVKDKKIEGISDLRDESDRDGMRIVVELKRDEESRIILNQLYKHTRMETTFGVNMLAIVEGQPRVLDIKSALTLFIDHRREITVRKTQYRLKKARERAHLLEGFKIALDNLDAVITLIRRSPTPAEAKDGLMAQFGLSEIQAKAILDMRLHRLTGLERDKILTEYREVLALIDELEGILGDDRKIMEILVSDFNEIRDKYGDERRTEIINEVEELTIEDLITEEEMVVTISHTGYIKRNPVSLYRSQRRGGKGRRGMSTKEEDFVEHLFTASTHSYILFFTTNGKVYWLKVHQLPQAGAAARGKAIVNLLPLEKGESISTFLPVREFEEDKYVFFCTKNGVVKRTDLMAFSRPRRTSGIYAIGLDEGDELISTRLTTDDADIMLSTTNGLSIRFSSEDVRPTGRTSRGVKGIALVGDDEVVAMDIVRHGAALLTVTENGYGKRTSFDEYRLQGRGGKGIITIKTSARNGRVAGVLSVEEEDQIILIAQSGKLIRMKASDISVIGRNTQGVKLFELESGESVSALAKVMEEEDS